MSENITDVNERFAAMEQAAPAAPLEAEPERGSLEWQERERRKAIAEQHDAVEQQIAEAEARHGQPAVANPLDLETQHMNADRLAHRINDLSKPIGEWTKGLAR